METFISVCCRAVCAWSSDSDEPQLWHWGGKRENRAVLTAIGNINLRWCKAPVAAIAD